MNDARQPSLRPPAPPGRGRQHLLFMPAVSGDITPMPVIFSPAVVLFNAQQATGLCAPSKRASPGPASILHFWERTKTRQTSQVYRCSCVWITTLISAVSITFLPILRLAWLETFGAFSSITNILFINMAYTYLSLYPSAF